MKWARDAIALLTAILAISGPAAAQQGEDEWDFGHDPARNLTIAAVTFDNFGVAVRCVEGSLGVLMSGLPADTGVRRMAWSMGGQPERTSQWVSGRESTTAFAVWPRSVAGEWAAGGQLVITVDDKGSPRRYAVELPPSTSAISRVFQTCGKALEPAGDNAVPSGESFAGLRWDEVPRVSFPGRAGNNAGIAALSCVAGSDGRLRECVVESEFPEGGGFGRAAVLGAHRTGRVAPVDPDGPSIEGVRMIFVTRYLIADGGSVLPVASRIRRPVERNETSAWPHETDVD